MSSEPQGQGSANAAQTLPKRRRTIIERPAEKETKMSFQKLAFFLVVLGIIGGLLFAVNCAFVQVATENFLEQPAEGTVYLVVRDTTLRYNAPMVFNYAHSLGTLEKGSGVVAVKHHELFKTAQYDWRWRVWVRVVNPFTTGSYGWVLAEDLFEVK